MTKTQEDRFVRDISAIKKSLQSIAEDLRYFRKKDEEAVAEEEKEEEPEYTCEDCTLYKRMAGIDSTIPIHWCSLYYCSMSEDSLKRPCKGFERRISDAAE